MQWKILSDTVPQSVKQVTQVLLQNRNISDESDFFSPKHPQNITLEEVDVDQEQMMNAVTVIEAAIKNQKKILVFGDYDADGITATAIMWLGLKQIGADVLPFIPHREKHGYGISDRSLDDILRRESDFPDLIITVDNGIVAHQAIDRVKQAGIQIVVTDHHQPEQKQKSVLLPAADAVVHSTQLCGASVGWLVVRELYKTSQLIETKKTEVIHDLLDLAGIGTVADQVPLKNANRSFAFHGISALRTTSRIGIQALCESAGVDQSQIDTYHINFVIAPRINAMGRLDHGLEALRLLCSQKKSTASSRAALLSQTNQRRQDLTAEMVDQAKKQVESGTQQKLVLVYSQEYHDGVIGLIAGKLTERYYKPAIAVSMKGEVAKASARSIIGVNIIELIRCIKDDLLEVGGHPMAAGFSFEKSKLSLISRKLQQLADEKISQDLLLPQINIECKLPFSLLSKSLVKEVNHFGPFGSGNRRPIFGLSKGVVLDTFYMGKEKQHLKVVIADPDALHHSLKCLVWNYQQKTNRLESGQTVNIAGSLDLNTWNGKTELQMVVKDISMVENGS